MQCETEPRNVIDRYSVAIMNSKEDLLLNIFHKGYPDCVRSFCDEKVPSKNFRVFNFWILDVSENIFAPKIFGFTVCISPVLQ